MPRTGLDVAPHRSAPASSEGWCLRHLGNGSFSPEGVYEWPPAVRQRCGFRMHSTGAARRLLRGRHVVFIGNSVQRRTMYALADLLGGDNATRLPEMPVHERIFDQHKGYHDFQHQRIDLTDGRAEAPVQGLDYCGVDPVLFECGTVRWGSSPSADEWRSSRTLEGWAFLLNATGPTTAQAARLARCRIALVRAALRPVASLALGSRGSPMVGPADADHNLTLTLTQNPSPTLTLNLTLALTLTLTLTLTPTPTRWARLMTTSRAWRARCCCESCPSSPRSLAPISSDSPGGATLSRTPTLSLSVRLSPN